jgi:periplasmic protein TonB
METKKSKSAELESKRSSFLIIGLVCASSLALMSFEYATFNLVSNDIASEKNEIVSIDDIFEIHTIEIEKPLPPKMPEKVNNEIINVTEKVEKVVEEKIEEEEETVSEIPDVPDFSDREEKYNNFASDIDPIVDETKPENPYSPNIKVPYYDYCAEFSNQEKLTCISNEIHKVLQKDLSKISTWQMQQNKKEKMYVQFVIDKNGLITDVEIANEEMFQKDIVKMVKQSMEKVPQMFPALKNGSPVGVYYSIPIKFHIQ